MRRQRHQGQDRARHGVLQGNQVSFPKVNSGAKGLAPLSGLATQHVMRETDASALPRSLLGSQTLKPHSGGTEHQHLRSAATHSHRSTQPTAPCLSPPRTAGEIAGSNPALSLELCRPGMELLIVYNGTCLLSLKSRLSDRRKRGQAEQALSLSSL